MIDIRYPATFERDEDNRIFVRFVDLPDVFTEGETEEEAFFNAAEVLTGALEWRLDNGMDIPTPGPTAAGTRPIAPDAKTQAALLIRQARGQRSIADLARALETSWPAAKRLEDAGHWPSLKAIDRAAAALGKRLVLALE